MVKSNLNKIKDNTYTQYALIGLGITIVGIIVNFFITILGLILNANGVSTGVLSIYTLFALILFISSIVLTGIFVNPILKLFGYRLVKK